MEKQLFEDTKRSAVISECGKYRYVLTREWDEALPKVMFIMLNPSTADAMKDDPTIRRCIGFAKSWGYGGIYVCNLFALRATNPKELIGTEDPFGAENATHTLRSSENVNEIICAWGNKPILKKLHKKHKYMDVYLEQLFEAFDPKLYCIDLSNESIPKHPLYLKKELKPKKIHYGKGEIIF